MPNITQVNKSEIQEWLVSYLNGLGLRHDEIDTSVEFEAHGLDSSGLLGLAGDLSEWLGYTLHPSIIFEYPTIDSLTDFLLVTPTTET